MVASQILSAVTFWQEMPLSQQVLFCAAVSFIGITLIAFIVFGAVLGRLSGRRFVKSCRTISDFSNQSGVINDGNLEQFEAACFDEKTDETFMEGWESFKTARFGYPSEYIDSVKIKSRFDSSKFKIALFVTSGALFLIATVFAIYFFVGLGLQSGYDLIPVIVFLVLPVILLLSYAFVKPEKKPRETFDLMLEDLDTAVRLQRYVERKIDNRRLYEIEDRIRDVIIAEKTKPIPSKKDQIDKKLREEEALSEYEEDLDDIREELLEDLPDDQPSAERIEVTNEEVSSDENESVEEEATATETDTNAEPAKKPVPFEPFVAVLNEAIDHGYPKTTLRKIANILVLAFGKFTEPAQREILKNSIRRFIVSYKAAVLAERESENSEVHGTEVADTAVADAYGEWQAPYAE
ncbi:MAG: hypothetical protein MSA47_01480 [Christensenellaceae bacterium]|nr:hypothetical protein [Christensenellaceae bacterium]